MSGVVAASLSLKVTNCGPKCIIFPLLIKISKPLPTALLVRSPVVVCFALRSPVIYDGWLFDIIFSMSGKGKYGLLGERYVVAIDIFQSEVSIVICRVFVVKSSSILCLIFL